MRLHQVSFAMGGILESGRQVGADALVELGRFSPPTLHALGARVAGQLSRRMYNVLITNVPGPQIPLYAAGFPVDAMYPVAPLALGQALAVSCTSYNGGVFFGMTADRDAIPDVEEFAVQIREAIEELRSTVPDESGPAAPTSRRGRRSRSSLVSPIGPTIAAQNGSAVGEGLPAGHPGRAPAALADGSFRSDPAVGFAVTDPLRAEYPDWSEEDLEYLAMQDAARASLRLLAGCRADEPPLRVVIAADVADDAVTPRPEADRAVVAVAGPVDWPQVAAVHIDGADAGAAVARPPP